VHKEQLDVTDVADEESLVAGGHHVLGLLVGTETDLCAAKEQPLASSVHDTINCRPNPFSTHLVPSPWISTASKPSSSSRCLLRADCDNGKASKRTEGITWLPLNRLRTRLSIPLGLRHAAATRIKRSLWWRLKVLVPITTHVRQ
jgi:hypothetical protein